MSYRWRRRELQGTGGLVTIVSDTFTRASDSVTLGTADTGQTWTNFGASRYTITAGQAAPFQSIGLTDGTVVNAATANGTMQYTVINSGGSVGAVFRWVDASNFMLWYYSSTTNLRLSKIVAGAETPLANDAVTAAGASVLYSATADSSNLITLKRAGVTIRTITDAANAAGTRWGFGGPSGTADFYDNFTVTTP